MSRTHARCVAAGVACALVLCGCGSADDPDASGTAAPNAGASGLSSSGVTFSDGAGDRVTFSSGADRVTFSSGQAGATFSSPGAASFSSQPAAAAPTTPVVPSAPATGTVGPNVATGGSTVDAVGAGESLDVGPPPAVVDESPSVGGLNGPDLAPVRGPDTLFGFWGADDVATATSPVVSEERVFRIALYGEGILVEWFSDEAREGGSGRNCWSADARDPVRLIEQSEAFVTAEPSADGSRAEYTVEPIGVLRVDRYSDEGLVSTTVHAPVLSGLSFVDFPVCDGA